jgi:serine/threonine protein kinase
VHETSPAIDVWAIGIMFYAMLYGTLPYWGESEDEFVDKIINNPLKFDPEVPVSQDCKDLIKEMLQKDPEKRIPLIDVMTKPYCLLDDAEIEERTEHLI